MSIRIIPLCAARVAAALALSLFALCAGAAEKPKAAGGESAAAPAPVIEPLAERVLRNMGKYLQSAKHFSFHAEIDFDDILPTGQKLQFSASNDIALSRPGRIYSEYRGELGSRRFTYDGKTMTLYDPALNMYASAKAPASVDQVLDELDRSYGFSPPLSDFLYAAPYETLRGNVQFGFYVGTSNVDGTRCNHLAFVEDHIDWQIWIEDGPHLVPRKIVITYKTIPGSPQFTALLSEWDFATPLADPLFEAQLPEDAVRIELAKLTKSDKPTKSDKTD